MSADEVLKPLEEAIAQYLIPALTKQPAPATVSRDLLALPARLGGLGIVKPITWGKCQQETSAMACKPLTELILNEKRDVSNATLKQRKIKKRLQQLRRDELRREAENTITALPLLQQKCARLAQEKGCSSWLVAIPIQRLGFTLHKGAFQDALCLRYGWDLKLAPSKCRCGEGFDVNHVLVCRQGGFNTIRHNELRDTFSSLLREVCQEVTTEPCLQPLSGEIFPRSTNTEANARLDIRARGFWDNMQDAFFDVRVFHPFAPSYQAQKLSSLYKQHEQKKRLEYGQRVREVEHGCFTPLVCTTSGRMAPEATVFLKRLASMLSEKRGEPYSTTMAWLRCVTGFCLVRSALRCLRASPRADKFIVNTESIAEAVAGGQLI